MNHSPLLVILISLASSALLSGCQLNPKQLTADRKPSETLESLFKSNPLLHVASVDQALQKAHEAQAGGNVELALAYYIKGFDLDPKNTQVLLEMADAYRKLGKTELVEVCYQIMLENDPANLEILERYGLLLIKQHKPKEAEEMLIKVVSTGGPSWKAYNGLGILSDMKRKYLEARNYYDLADALSPQNPEVLNNKGYSLFMENHLDEAEYHFMRALRINPQFKQALYNYGLVKGRKGEYAQALSAFSKALTVPEANNNTGYIAMINGDMEQAEFYLKQAIKLSSRYYGKAHENLSELKNQKRDRTTLLSRHAGSAR